MTKQEHAELFDSLYYGHDAELKIAGEHYFIEWSNNGIDIFLMVNESGTKVASVCGKDRNDTLTKLFDITIVGDFSINNSFSDIEILDIE